jgi:hypothetical protein
MARFNEPTDLPQMTAVEFAAALKQNGFRVVRAKVEDATGRCLPTAAKTAVVRVGGRSSG